MRSLGPGSTALLQCPSHKIFSRHRINIGWTSSDRRKMVVILRPLGYERVYLPLYKVADTPFYIQRDDLLSSNSCRHDVTYRARHYRLLGEKAWRKASQNSLQALRYCLLRSQALRYCSDNTNTNQYSTASLTLGNTQGRRRPRRRKPVSPRNSTNILCQTAYNC